MSKRLQPGDPAPDFTLPTPDGDEVPLESLRGGRRDALCQPPLRRVSTRPATSVAPAARRTRAISLREKPSE